MTVIIDSREPKGIIQKLSEECDVKKDWIEVGDYLFANGYAVERKETDLIQSIMSHRIFDQLNNLSNYEHPILAYSVENLWKSFYFSRSKYIHKQYQGFLTTLCVKYPKITVIPYSDENQFISFIISLEKKIHSTNGKVERPSPIMRKGKSLKVRRENALTAIDGVSIAKSKMLLKHFGSINKLAQASQEELMKVPNVGKKLSENIYKLLN